MTDQLAIEWGTIYQKKHGAKHHLMPDCPRAPDGVRKKPVDAFPPNHRDLCTWCEGMFERWRDNMDVDDKPRCERCGTPADTAHYCRDCQDVIHRREAQRKL